MYIKGPRKKRVGLSIKEELNIHNKKGLLIQYETRTIVLKILLYQRGYGKDWENYRHPVLPINLILTSRKY